MEIDELKKQNADSRYVSSRGSKVGVASYLLSLPNDLAMVEPHTSRLARGLVKYEYVVLLFFCYLYTSTTP